jgi:hypothetical protein
MGLWDLPWKNPDLGIYPGKSQRAGLIREMEGHHEKYQKDQRNTEK